MIKYTLLHLILFLALMSCEKNTGTINKMEKKVETSKQTALANKKEIKPASYYTCSMHPHVKKDKGGKCPICHMRLTKIQLEEPLDVYPSANTSSNNNAEVAGVIQLKKSQLKHFRAAIFKVRSMLMSKKIHLLGSIIQSEETESKITARISGRVEKVYIKSTGSLIKKSSPIVDLYSPKLITAGEEYLIARKSYNKNKSKVFKNMLKQSTQRLKLWGIKSSQYNRWFTTGRVPKTITIYSPSTGIVRKRNASVGKYFKEGQVFFELSDLSNVWVEMDVYEHDAALIEIGQVVNLQFTALPGETLNSEIDFINPVLNSVSRTLKIRASINNSTGKLKPGMVAKAQLNIQQTQKALVVPKTAIIDTGKRKVVWIQISNKLYQAKIIHTGYESGGYVEVKQGLELNDKVVLEGNFLLDAQAQLFGGYENIKTKKQIKKNPHQSH